MNKDEARRWLAYSHSDLKAARKLHLGPDYYSRQVCFLAQQSAEKSLKAILVLLEIEFPFSHDLDRLRELVPDGWKVKKEFPQLFGLSIWAIESRYPGDMPDVLYSDAEDALSLAEAIYQRAVEEINEF